jgi:transposase
MPRKRLSMRKIREILRLKYYCNRSIREISQSCGMGRGTVGDYLHRAKAAGLSWPLPDELSDTCLEQQLFPSTASRTILSRFTPDFHEVHKELQSRKNVTLNLLWQEYKEQHPDGYQYSWFCHSYRDWAAHLDVVMRHEHRAGEKLFVDYTGQTVAIVDGETGEIQKAQIFVAVLGASNFTYAEATLSQKIEDWIGSHVRAFSYIGGVPEAVVPDNLKSGVIKTCRYEPDINPTYNDLARHYQTVILPARVRKPRDKAKAEAGVLLVERWILAKLRNHTFFSLVDLNREIRKLLQVLNSHSFKKLPGTRQSWFEEIDRPALKPLPASPYELAYWKKATVHLDYHVEVEGYYYSVPHTLAKKKLDIRYTQSTVECFYSNKRVASHLRKVPRGRHATVKEHMPLNHQKYLEWNPERFKRWAAKIGPETVILTELLLLKRTHPQQAYRTLLGVQNLSSHRFCRWYMTFAKDRSRVSRNFILLKKNLDFW